LIFELFTEMSLTFPNSFRIFSDLVLFVRAFSSQGYNLEIFYRGLGKGVVVMTYFIILAHSVAININRIDFCRIQYSLVL
jgi:hypothetical protein